MDGTVVSQNDSVYSDASMFDDTIKDPTFTTRAAIDPNAQPPVTRSASIFNLLNVGFAFCTGLPTTPDEACYGVIRKQHIKHESNLTGMKQI